MIFSSCIYWIDFDILQLGVHEAHIILHSPEMWGKLELCPQVIFNMPMFRGHHAFCGILEHTQVAQMASLPSTARERTIVGLQQPPMLGPWPTNFEAPRIAMWCIKILSFTYAYTQSMCQNTVYI